MSNIVISPQSGVIEFNNGTAGSSSFSTSTAPIRLDATGGNVWFTGSNVGIGTTDPTDILTINQTADSNGIRINGYDDHSSSFAKLFVKSNGHAELSQSTNGADGYLKVSAENYLQLSAGTFVYTDDQFRIYDDGQLSLGNGADYFFKYDNSINKLKIHSSTNDGITMDISGRVGIGTTNPIQELQVNGSIYANGGHYFVNTTKGIYWGDSQQGIVGTTDTSLEFKTNNATQMIILDNGNVGIGNTNPATYKLQVGGEIGVGNYMMMKSSATYMGMIGFNRNGNNGAILNNSYGAFQLQNHNGTLNLECYNSGGVIQAEHAFKEDGKVGIGVTNPDATLEVKGAGNSNASTSFVVRDSDDAVLLKARNDGVVTVEHGYFYVSASAGAYVQNNFRVRGSLFNDQGTLQIGNSSGTAFDGDVNFDSNTLFVDSSNNRVGIGTSSPNKQLQIGGAEPFLRLEESSSGGNKRLDLFVSNSTGVIGANQSAQTMMFQTVGTTRMTIEAGGDVGIGTTNPQTKLTVGSDGDEDGLEVRESGDLIFKVRPSSSHGYLSLYDSSTNEDVRLNSNGNSWIGGGSLGVGMTSPSARLELKGGTSDSSANAFIARNSSSTSLLSVRNDGRVDIPLGPVNIGDTLYLDNNEIWAKNSNNLNVKADGLIRIQPQSYGTAATFATDGNVGIGSSSPAYKLDVDGTIHGTSGNFETAITINGNPVVTGSSASEGDTLATVTARGATTSSNLTLNGDITVASSKYIGIGSTLAAIQFGDGSVGNETADLSFVTNSDGEITFNRGGNAVIIGSDFNIYKDTNISAGHLRLDDTYKIEWGGTNARIDGSNSSDYLRFFTSNTERIRIVDGGNVGIGTTGPNQLLHVDGKTQLGTNGFSEGGLLINYASLSETKGGASTLLGNAVYAGTTNNTFRRTKGDAGNYIALNYNKGITFHTNVTGNTSDDYDINNHEQMRLTTGGFLGIGTTDPLGTTHIYTADAGGTIATNASHDDLIIENNGNCGIQLSSPASSYQYLAFGDTASANQGYVRYYHSSDRMDLRAGGSDILSLVGSKVGIGTTNPQEELDLRGDMRLDSGGTTDRSIYFRNQSSIAKVRSDAALQFDVGVSSSPSAAMYIQEDTRNVGIGTTGPVAKLEVQTSSLHQITSGLLIHNNVSTTGTAGNGVGITMGRAGGVYASKIANVWTNNNPSYLQTNIAFYTMHDSHLAGSETEKMRLTSQGRLGIGVTNPSERLEVNPDNDSSAILGRAHVGYIGHADYAGFSHVDKANSTSYSLLQSAGGDTFLNCANGYQIFFRYNNTTMGGFNASQDFYVDTDTLYVDASEDKVGIGSSSPAVELDVVGTGDFDSVRILNSTQTLNPRLILGRDINQNIQFHVVDNDCTITADQDSDSNGDHKFILNRTFAGAGENDFQIAKGGTAQVTVDTDGNVGIGVTNPSRKLFVQGDAEINTNLVVNTALYTKDWYGIGSNDQRILNSAGTAQVTIENGGEVGIGTTNPSDFHSNANRLVVGDGAGAEGITIFSQDNNAGYLYFADGTAGDAAYRGFLQYSHSTNNLSLGTAGGTKLTIASDGSVGIGSTSPLQKLDVAGVIRSSSTSRIQADTYNNSANSANIIYRSSSKTIVGNNASALVVMDGGNVGIGTTDPVVLLHVDGSSPKIRLRDNDAAGTPLAHIDASDGALKLQADSSDETASSFLTLEVDGSEHVRVASDGKVGIGVTDPDNPLEVSGADNGIKIYSASSDRPRLTLDCGGTDKLILSSNSTYGAIGDSTDTNRYMVFNGGKVGLGTTTPAHQLHLNKEDAIAEMQISRGGSDPSTNTDIGRIQFKTDYSASPNEVGSIWVRTNSSAYRTDMRFGVKATAGSEEVGLTIHGTNDGPLVGIGTTNPQRELEIHGAGNVYARITASTDNDSAALELNNNGNAIWTLKADDTDSDSFKITHDSAGTALTIDTSKNVGIGTSSPSNALDVNGAIAVGSSYAGSSAPSNGMVIQGSVGIGTSSPSYDLHVEGEILAESNMLLGGDGTYGSTYGAIGIGTTSLTNGHHRIFAKSSDHMYFAAASSKGFRFRANGGSTDHVTIDSGGDLGIGTTSPANKLDVAGGIAIGASYVGNSAPSNGAIIEGYVGIGTSSNSYYPLYVNGTLYATSKYFIIDHPVPEKKAQHKKLLHACIEGPEVAVYFRGKNDLNIIKMPDYWDSLVHIDSMTVELTPIGANQDIYVDSIADNGDVTIGANTDAPLNYFYVVYGERKDVDKLEPEIVDPEYAD